MTPLAWPRYPIQTQILGSSIYRPGKAWNLQLAPSYEMQRRLAKDYRRGQDRNPAVLGQPDDDNDLWIFTGIDSQTICKENLYYSNIKCNEYACKRTLSQYLLHIVAVRNLSLLCRVHNYIINKFALQKSMHEYIFTNTNCALGKELWTLVRTTKGNALTSKH